MLFLAINDTFEFCVFSFLLFYYSIPLVIDGNILKCTNPLILTCYSSVAAGCFLRSEERRVGKECRL